METNPQLELAFNFLEYTGTSIFLTGKAGTGKTTFLRELKRRSPKRMIVVAPTGVAAINAGGVTIHSFFQLPFGPYVPGRTEENRSGEKRFNHKFGREKINIIRSMDLLVIDEISMVRADLLDAVSDMLCKDEGDEVESVFGPNGQFDLNFIRVNAQERYYSKLAGVTEPEQKRKIIGEEFIRVFEEEAKKIGAVDFLAQGTIYPDVVESGLGGESAVIKSHHNVGGLPDFVDFKEIIEPLRNLFKDEVRKAGLELGIPENLVFRQPFPGPGLGIRIIGEVNADKVRIVQDADYIYRDEVDKAVAAYKKEHGKNPSWMPNQYFAALTNMRSVGVMGDERTYDYAVALRAVNTVDFMTAESAEIPFAVLQTVMSRIINEVRGVNRVFYDLTSKPPGTIEFE